MRAVKSLSARAAGPTTRAASRNESLVAHSTIRRAGRSVRLQTMARSALTSPLWTPYGTAGRARSGVTTAGAVPWAHARRQATEAASPPAARVDRVRNLRRSMWTSSWGFRREYGETVLRGCVVAKSSHVRVRDVRTDGGRPSSERLLLRLELHVLVRRHPRIPGDETEPRFRHPGSVPVQDGELPDRQVHHLLVHQLLDAVEDRLPLLGIQFPGLLPEEPVDVGITSVRVDAGPSGERLDPGGGVSVDPADGVDEILELLVLEGLEEPGALQGPELRPDPGGLQVVDGGLARTRGRDIAPEIAGVEALRIPGLGQELLGPGGIVGVDRRLPVEVE